MGCFDSDHRVFRGFSERALERKVESFIEKQEEKGEHWMQEGSIEHRPARLVGYKPYIAVLRRL